MKQERSMAPGTRKASAIPGLLPRPRPPRVISIAAPRRFVAQPGAPVVAFSNDRVITRWLCRVPVEAGAGAQLARAAGQPAKTDSEAFGALSPLPRTAIVKDSWPDVTDAIDLNPLGNGQARVHSLFFTVLRVSRPRLARVCHGACGMNTSARMWISGRKAPHGTLVRLAAGRHPVVMEVYHGHDGEWIKWNMARLAPRFTVVTKAEIAEVHRWHLRNWEFTRQAARMDESRLFAGVRIDPATLRGREGFIRVGRDGNGRWWLLDADGKILYHRGSTGLNAGGIGGRRASLPPVDERTARKWISYLKKWRFNAMGAWSTPEFFDKGLAFAETIEGFYVEPWLETKFPDVFDPKWAENLDAKCRSICPQLKDSRRLIGYFLDNERGFMEVPSHSERYEAASPTYRRDGPLPEHGLELAAEPKLNVRGVGLLQYCLSLNGGRPASERAWQFVANRHGTVENVGRAWGVAMTSREDIRRMTASEELLVSETYLRDLRDFVALWVEQYYRVFTETIRRYDPNHLILGMRHGGTPAPVTLAVESRWTDVISQNMYRAEFYENFDLTYRASGGAPILNGEFNTHTDSYNLARNPIEPPGGHDVATRWHLRGQTALDRLATHPGVVGYTMYRWNGHGNDDKLWAADRPNQPVADELCRTNYRTTAIAASCSRHATRPAGPLSGQVFLCLENGASHRTPLHAARPDAKPGTLVSAGSLHIGLVCRQGRWSPTVYGDGIRGRVTAQKRSGQNYRLRFRLKRVPGVFGAKETTEAVFTVEVAYDGRNVDGAHTGRYGGEPVSGRVLGFLYRPVPTPNL
jgi:hypothetical protein